MANVRAMNKDCREMKYERRKRKRRELRERGMEVEDSTDSSGTGDEWHSRRKGIKERGVRNKEEMRVYFEEQYMRRDLRDVMESGSSIDSEEVDVEEYGRMLQKGKREWYEELLKREVPEDVVDLEEDEVVVGSDGKVLGGEPEVLQEEQAVGYVLYDAVVELEDMRWKRQEVDDEDEEVVEEPEEVEVEEESEQEEEKEKAAATGKVK